MDICACGHASASAISDNGNVCGDEAGFHNEIIANPVGSSPAQIWYVGNMIDNGVNLSGVLNDRISVRRVRSEVSGYIKNIDYPLRHMS